MRHKFYLPLGHVNLPAPPDAPQEGDTYFDTVLKEVRTWDGTKWASGGGTISAGAGLDGGGAAADDISLDVKVGPGIRIINDRVTLDTAYTSDRYVLNTGDTMTGPLMLPEADPAYEVEAAHKRYVDSRSAAIGEYGITAGNGLAGGGPLSSRPTIHVGGGTGIIVGADTVALDLGFADARWSSSAHGHSYAAVSHTHGYKQVGVSGTVYAVGNIDVGDTAARTIPHGLGRKPVAVSAIATADSSNVASVFCSVDWWDATNVRVLAKNIGNNPESINISVIVIG